MNVFINIYRHINSSVLPLRFGINLKERHQRFAFIENAMLNEKLTNNQREFEKKKGREFYSGILNIKSENRRDTSHKLEGMWNIEPSPNDGESPSVVTGLKPEFEDLRSSAAVTNHIEGLLKANRISTQDIIDYMHPIYLEGGIRSSNDVEDVYRDLILPVKEGKPIISAGNDQGIIDSGDDIISTIADLPQPEEETPVDEGLTAPLVYEPLRLKPSIKYQYVMADAYIDDAGTDGNRVWAKIINSKGEKQLLASFTMRDHLKPHHELTLDYLKSRIGHRALIAICMSDPYKGTLAESVTSISLQLLSKKSV